MKRKLSILLLTVVLTGCSFQDKESVDETSSQATNESTLTPVTNTITLGETVTQSSSTATIDDDTITLNESGSYKITGTSTDKKIVINDENLDIDLTLDNVQMNFETAAIQVLNANSLNLHLSGKSTIEDGQSNDEDQAPIYIDEVETHIDGDGSLELIGNSQEGFESNNDLIIDGGTISITAKDDGINVGDNLIINDGKITIDSNGDGLDSNGSMEINGGTIYVSAGNNGNGPIDYAEEEGETFEVNGGTLIAVGGNMGVSTTKESQKTRSGMASGTTIKIGNDEWTAPKEFSYYFVTNKDLTDNTEITVDGNQTTDTTGETNTMGGGGNMEDRPELPTNANPSDAAIPSS